jgi:hypothetical protein
MTPSRTRLYVAFGALSALTIVLTWLAVRPASTLAPDRRTPTFELDEPPPAVRR